MRIALATWLLLAVGTACSGEPSLAPVHGDAPESVRTVPDPSAPATRLGGVPEGACLEAADCAVGEACVLTGPRLGECAPAEGGLAAHANRGSADRPVPPVGLLSGDGMRSQRR